MIRAQRIVGFVAALGLGLLASCGGGDAASSAGASSTSELGLLIAGSSAVPEFVSAMVDAPERVAHGGVRRVEYHLVVAGVPASLVYDERVTADGQGRYAIDPIAVASPVMSVPQRELFEELQRARQGFFFKYRDLRVRGLDLFLQNYLVQVLASAPVVAGVECVEIQITPRNGPARSYRLAIEARSGLVLRSIERDAGGTTIASTTYLEFTRDPVLAGVEFHVERFPGTPLATAALSAGAAPAAPSVLPVGYREVSSEVVQLAGTTYIRRVYGDGLENVFFLERVAATLPTSQATVAVPKLTVRMSELGPFRIAEVVRGGGSFFLVGKISETDVLEILRSAL